MGQISALRESQELFSREYGGEASVLWVWNGDHWNLSGRSSWSYSPVAQTGVGLVWERVQVERGGRRLEPQSAPLPLARLAPVSKGATSSYS